MLHGLNNERLRSGPNQLLLGIAGIESLQTKGHWSAGVGTTSCHKLEEDKLRCQLQVGKGSFVISKVTSDLAEVA